jgi:hypothetical protein
LQDPISEQPDSPQELGSNLNLATVALVWQALRPIANITADEITLRFFKRHYGPEEAIDSLEPFRATLLKR